MSDLVKMIQEANRNERPHPLTTVHGPRAVQPIYAISKHELSDLTSRIEALEAFANEVISRCEAMGMPGHQLAALARAALTSEPQTTPGT